MRMRGMLAALALSIAVLAQEIQLIPVISNIDGPTDIQDPADGTGRIFLVQQQGLIRILRDGALLPEPFLDIRAKTVGEAERGLLGLAFPPGFAGKQRFYVNYTDLNGDTVVALYQVSDD